MHDAILGFYEPKDDRWCTKCFGTTINILNGDHECRKSNNSTANDDRAYLFKSFIEHFETDAKLKEKYLPEDSLQDLNCKGQPSLDVDNGYAHFNYLDIWDNHDNFS